MAVSGSIINKKIDDSEPLSIKSKANNTLGDSLSYIGQKAVAGAAGTIEGIGKLPGLISNMFSGNGAYAARMAGTGVVDKWRRSLEEQYDPGEVLSFLGSAAEGVGQSSTFLLNAIPGLQGVGSAMFFTGILGNSIENAASKTGDLGFKELGYGTTVAAAEWLLERISGAGGQAAKVLAGKTAKSLGKTAVYEAVRNSIGKELISEAAGEFVEEFLGDYVDVGAQRLFGIDKNATVSLKEALYSGLVGALSGFTMAAGTSGISSAVKIAAGNKVKANGNTDTLLKMADAVANEFKSSKVGEGFGGNMNGRMNELIQNLQASTRAYQNLSPEAQNSARGSLILGEIQSAMTMIESTAAVELETEKVKANAELYAEYAKALTDGKVQYTAEDILENKNNITTQLAVMRFAREMLTPGEVTMARDRVRQTIQNELAARGVKITEEIANGKTVEEATVEADKSPLTENTRLITDFSTTSPAGTYKVYGDKFIDVTEDTDDNGNVTGYTLYYSDSDTADKGLSVEELSSKIGNIVDANFDAVNEAMLESFAAEKTAESKNTAEEENAAESEKSSEKANNKKSEAQHSIRDTISNIVNRVGGNKKQTLSKEELSDRASRAALQDKARKAVDGFDLLDVERRMAIEYMYESAAQNGISQKDADICAALMSKLNTDIGFANIENDRINGVHNWIDDHSVIVLNANKNISVTIAWALAHESAHSLERSAGYKALAEDVLKYSSKEYQQATIDTYKKANPDMSDEDIQKEVVADSLASILLKGKKLESLVAQNQSILSKAFRWITNFAKTFKNKNDVATAIINRIARQYGNALGYNRVQVISDVATVVIGKKAAVRYKNAKEQKAEVKRLTEIGIDQGVNYEGFTVNTDNTVFEEGADRTKLGYAVNNVNMIYSEAENKMLLQTIIDVDKIYCVECEADVDGKVLNVTKAYISDDLKVNEAADEQGDIQFSIALNGKITKAQQTYLDKNKTGVTQDQLDTAKEQETRVAERLKGMADILPEDTPGNVIRSNGSYGKSIENTTICVRTLVYNAFVEKVQKIINRPMTAMESFLVSQKLYDIAVDPQCLYCYVSLDRKAYYDYAIKYLKNRDVLIEKYKKLGIDTVPKSSRSKAELKEAIQNPQTEFDLLYKNWLKDRVPTVKSWQDFAYMIRSYHNGEKQLQLSDLATNESRTKAAQDEELVRQLQMTLRYAQSASYAKAQIEYESYNGNILKMSQDLVNELNQHYGLRWYSFSDFTAAFVLENMQQFTDAALRGLKGLAYTKDINFVKIFAPTGCNINVSTFVKKDKNGNYYLDKRQSANVISEDGSTISDEMKALKEKYPNVGIVVTATDDGGVEWALNQDWSDVVIPFHIVKTGQEVADYYGWKNFSHSQKDYVVDKAKWEEARAALGRKQSDTDVMPSEHNNDKATYMRLLEERGLKPRFEAFINNPNYMKLVNECRQNGDQTEFLKAEFDYDAIDGVLDQFVEKGGYFDGWYNEGVDEDAEAKIVADDIIDGRTADEVIYGNQRFTPEEVMAKRRTNRQHRGGQLSITEGERQAEAIEYSDINTQYSISPDGYDGKTIVAYKAFYAYDGHLYPPMVSNLSEEKQKLVKNKIKGNESGTMRGLYTPLGVWLNADVGGIYLDKNGEVARNSKGRLQVKNDKGGGSLAFRPGWHLGEYPDAKQFNKEDENGNRTLMPANLVFAECEISADIDYQLEAMSYGVNKKGRFDRTQAGMPQIPVDGYYKYRTNPNPDTAPWYIAGSMKVNRILTDEEIKKLLPKGITMDRREGGIELTAEVLKNTYGIDAGVVSPETNIDAFKKNQRNIDNEKLLEQALNDERYADAYVKRNIDFNDPNVVNEFKINNLDIDNYKPKVQYSFANSTNGTANDKLIPYTKEQKALIESYGNVVIDSYAKLEEQVNRAYDNENDKAALYFGFLDKNFLKEIEAKATDIPKVFNGKIFGKDDNYSVVITLDGIRHLKNERDLTRSEIVDLVDRLADTIAENDSVAFSYYNGEENKKEKGLLFKKAFNDGVTVSYNIVSNKKKSLNMQTMYIEDAEYKGKKSNKKRKPVYLASDQNVRGFLTSETQANKTFDNTIPQTNPNVKSNGQFSLSDSEVLADAKKYFGVTTQIDEAGFLTTDGKLLDFSGRHEADENHKNDNDFLNRRYVDHHAGIRELYDEYDIEYDTEYPFNDFVNRGNIRIFPEAASVELSVLPNQKQQSRLKTIFNYWKWRTSRYDDFNWIGCDITDENGKTIKSFDWRPSGTSADKMMSDIVDWFENGKKSDSVVSIFHNMQYSLIGVNKDGIEVFETSPEIMRLSWKDRISKYLDIMKDEYRGRTARFVRNGHTYYAQFDRSNIRKPIYGDNRSDRQGVKALINAGASGDIFDLVENSTYDHSKSNTKTHTNADYFDYFIKTVQIDGRVFDLIADVEKKLDNSNEYVYTVALKENKKISASPALGQKTPVNLAGIADIVNTIPQTDSDVKRNRQFSLTPEQKLENEKDRLKAKNEYNQALKEFASQTGFQDAREVDAIGTRMFEGTGGEAQQYRNRARLLKTAAAMDFIAQYPNSENALKARKKVAETLRDLAIVSLSGKNSPLYQTDINLKERLSEFRNTLKNIRINVSNIQNDLAGGWNEFRKKNAFRLRLTTSSANSYTADQVYNDFIKGNFDDLMNLNYAASMNEADLLNEIVRVLDIDPMYETMPFEEAVNNQISEMETAINLAIAHQRVNTEGYAEGIEEGIRRAVGKYGSVYRISDANKIVRDLDGVSVNGVSVYDRSDYSPRRFLDRVIMDLNGAHDGNIESVARVLAAEYIRQKEFEINGDAPIFGSALMTDHPVLFNNLLEQYTKIIVNGWTKYGSDTRNTLLQGLLQIEKAAHRQDVKVLKGVNRLANAFNRLNEMTGKKKTSDVIDNAEMDAVGRMLTRILYQGNIVPKRVYQFAQAMNAIFSKSEDNMTGTELFLFRNMSEVSKETIKEILAQGENVAIDPQMVEALNGIAREIIHSYEHFGQVKISFDNSPATWQDAKPIAERGIDQANNAFMSVNDNIVKKWLTSGLLNKD